MTAVRPYKLCRTNETCRTENNLIHSMFKSCSDGLKIIVASDAQPNSLILDMNISLNFFLVFSSKNFLETLTMSDGIFFVYLSMSLEIIRLKTFWPEIMHLLFQ